MTEQSKIENPKLVPDRDPGSKIVMLPPNVLARADKVIK
jgi:hypothetical protein